MRSLRLLLALVGFALIGASPAAAQTFPKFTGSVVDDANVLPPNVEADLTAKLQALQKDTNRQVIVATIGDMQGYPLEDYGYKLGRAWGVGLKDANNGVILFVAPNNPAGQRGPRTEVGRGLEPILPDALTSVIINQDMMPKLRNGGDVAGALTAGTDAVIAQLRASPEEQKAKVDAAVAAFDKAQPRARQSGGGGFPIGIVFWVMILAFVGLSFARHRSGKGQRYTGKDDDDHRGGGSGMLPVILWSIANEIGNNAMRGGGGGGSSWGGGGGDSGGGGWGGGGFTGGGGGDFGGGGASGSW